jgi:thiol-disulfide isomerase/thioredoxin
MRSCAAPEARGSRSITYVERARRGGSAILIAAFWLASIALASSPQNHATPLQLLAAPRVALPSFALPDVSGSILKLEERAGRVVLVHFFATWCEPCREELASLSRLVESPLGKRVAVLAVNVAEVPLRVRRFLDAGPVSFPVALDADRAVTRAWGVGVLPTTFVLDPKLNTRLFVEGDIDWSRPDIVSVLEELDAEHGK